jgi:hypothetical protein
MIQPQLNLMKVWQKLEDFLSVFEQTESKAALCNRATPEAIANSLIKYSMAPAAIITGASQGIGKETTLLFASKGYNLVLAARQAERLEALASKVRSLRMQCYSCPYRCHRSRTGERTQVCGVHHCVIKNFIVGVHF